MDNGYKAVVGHIGLTFTDEGSLKGVDVKTSTCHRVEAAAGAGAPAWDRQHRLDEAFTPPSGGLVFDRG